ncbi:MAG: hypothetical protein K9N07_09610 [Candidatus Cloacimonetes bacterium]|nr:hypothetical protein [Candidatus Cloacimonadota bacterium]
MLTNEDIELIHCYYDEELEIDKEEKLFLLLGNKKEARELLRKLKKMRKEITAEKNNLSEKVELPAKQKNIFKPLFYFSAAASLILAVSLAFQFSAEPEFDKYHLLKEELANMKVSEYSNQKVYENFDMEMYSISQKLNLLKDDIERDPL